MILQMHRPVDLNKLLEVGRDELSTDRLCAAMIFPNDADSQVQYFREQALPSISPAKETSASVDGSSFSGRIVEATNNGVLAGTCLMYFHLLRQTDIKTKAGNDLEVSQRVVFYLCQKYNLGRTRKADEDRSNGYPTITIPHARENWKRYQRVSHLWAAYVYLKGLPVRPRPTDHVFECIDLSVLLFIARQYERFVTEFFDGQKVGLVPREEISPFRARYYDWNQDDVCALEILEPRYVSNWVAEAAKGYVADF